MKVLAESEKGCTFALAFGNGGAKKSFFDRLWTEKNDKAAAVRKHCKQYTSNVNL